MIQELLRVDGRTAHQLRPITITYNAFGYASGSVLFELGNTKVLCAVSLQQGVPHFLKGTKTGWLTAEYSLLPTSTTTRVQRESANAKPNGRTIEISRLIGRALRMVVNLDLLGERTITVDCDVLQADGGTRTACITGAYLALRQAVDHWIAQKEISTSIITDEIAALSLGVKNNQVLLDINYEEDSTIDADYNIVLTRSGTIVEIQGSLERGSVSWPQFNNVCEMAQQGIAQLFATLDPYYKPAVREKVLVDKKSRDHKQEKQPLFSLKNRLLATGK